MEQLVSREEALRRRIKYLNSEEGQRREAMSWRLWDKSTKDLTFGELMALENEFILADKARRTITTAIMCIL